MKSLAERIAHLTPQQRALYELRRKQQQQQQNRTATIPRLAGPGPWPASMDQAALWFFHRMNPASPAYNISSASRLKGVMRSGVLERALNALVSRHEILRTTFREIEGDPYQIVAPSPRLSIPVTDLRDRPPHRRDEEARREVTRGIQEPFDLEKGPLVRLSLVRLGDEDHVMLAVLHHTLTDWWSFQIFFGELFALYKAYLNGKTIELPNLPIQFSDYAVWRNQWMGSQAFRDDLEYWLGQVKGAPTVLELPADKPRPPVQSYQGSREFFELPHRITRGIHAMNREANASSLMTTLACTFAFLSRYTGQDDLLVGASVTNRELKETERLIGYLLNILVLRGDLRDDPDFKTFLQRVRTMVLQALDHKELPFQSLVKALNPERDLSRMPLYQVEFIYVSPQRPSLHNIDDSGTVDERPPFLEKDFHIDRQTSAVDLQISFLEFPSRFELWLEYSTDLFLPETVRNMGRLLIRLMEEVVANPAKPISAISLLSEAERAGMRRSRQRTPPPFPETRGIHQLFEQWARRDPNKTALECGDRRLSYGELEQRAARLAADLRARGIAPEQTVALSLERSIEMVVALLAILKTGAAYIPVDPGHPRERRLHIVADAAPSLLITEEGHAAEWAGLVPELFFLNSACGTRSTPAPEPPAPAFDSRHPAYVIYTSGSTGQPKGVVVTHRSVVNFLTAMAREPGIGRADRLLAVTTLSFDIAGLELYLPLANGATVVMAERETSQDARLLARAIEGGAITLMQATPATWQMLFDSGWRSPENLCCLCGGEALGPGLAERLATAARPAWNLYGPTETTIWSTRAPIESGRIVHIGKPIENTRLHVVDRHMQPVPVRVTGELLIGGEGLARGYRGRPGLTAARFPPDPLAQQPGARLYRSGDVVRLEPSGDLVFQGRIDQQVKLRGFRIEPAEIELHLRAHPRVKDAVVRPVGRGIEDKHLVAYLVQHPGTGELQETRALQEFLGERVPRYMVPSAFVVLEAYPLTPNGKLDVAALPEPDAAALGSSHEYVAPRSPREAAVVEVWSDLLKKETIGIHDHFFALGGHSLMAGRIVTRLRELLGVAIPMKAVFENPVVADLARFIEISLWASKNTKRDSVEELEEAFEEEGEI